MFKIVQTRLIGRKKKFVLVVHVLWYCKDDPVSLKHIQNIFSQKLQKNLQSKYKTTALIHIQYKTHSSKS